MFTDMVGYSALAQRNEALALELLEEHRRLVRELLPPHKGREVETIGDGFLLEFPSALAAVQSALAIQHAQVQRNQLAPPQRHFRIRIGIHVGDVVDREDNIQGDAVNIAARIEPLAAAGGICLSDAVVTQVRNKLDLGLTKLAAPELKHIEVPIEVYAVVLPGQQPPQSEGQALATTASRPKVSRRALLAGVAALVILGPIWWLWVNGKGSTAAHTAAGPITSLAVKPLDDFSSETNQAYLSDGMTEALCAALGNVSALRVPGRSSVMRYKGTQKSIREMARELNVDAIVEGSVQRAANRALITVQLVEAASDRHVWATHYERDLSDFFKVQNEVAQAIAAEVQVHLSPHDQARLAQARAVSPAALDAYLQGRFHLARSTKEGFEKSLLCFKEALRLDPQFAKAYSGIADAYALAGGWWADDAVVLSVGFQAATNAVALDANAPEPQASLGWFYMMSWRWRQAEDAFNRALELDPRYVRAVDGYGWLHLFTGRNDSGLKLLVRAQELEPGDPIFSSDVAWASIRLGRYDQALTYIDKALAIDRGFWFAQGLRGMLLAFQGDYNRAIESATQAVQASQANAEMVGNLGWIYGKAGDSAKARVILDQLLSEAKPLGTAPVHVSWVYLGLGQSDEAIQQLQEAVRVRSGGLMFLRFDPRFDPIRQDPRFQGVLKATGLQP
jgi:TolB-like protein/class 3 adenylate cyclase/Tfp pilus assembly protein PilF